MLKCKRIKNNFREKEKKTDFKCFSEFKGWELIWRASWFFQSTPVHLSSSSSSSSLQKNPTPHFCLLRLQTCQKSPNDHRAETWSSKRLLQLIKIQTQDTKTFCFRIQNPTLHLNMLYLRHFICLKVIGYKSYFFLHLFLIMNNIVQNIYWPQYKWIIVRLIEEQWI